MSVSKIQLSLREQELIEDAAVILTKNSALQKVASLMQDLQSQMQACNLAGEVFSISPKISRGEQYLGLPYVVLDYPRYAQGPDLCFIRTLFWWGRHFSSTLQLSGRFVQPAILIETHSAFVAGNYYLGINPDPWQHHFGLDNYHPISSMSAAAFAAALEDRVHIKIAAKWPLNQWNTAAIDLWKSWNFLTGLIA